MLSDFLALSCAFLWAVNSLILRTQSRKITPAGMNVIRCGVAGVLFLLLLPFDAPLASLGQVPWTEWALLLGSVFTGLVVGDTLYLAAIREIGVARSMALSGTYPLATILFEQVLLRQPVTQELAWGAVLVVAGVVCLCAPASALPALEVGPAVGLKLGVILALASAVLWGLSTVLLKPAIAHLTVIQANALRMPLVAALLYLFSRLRSGPPEDLRRLEPRVLLAVASTGVLGMGVGAALFLAALDLAGPARTVTLSSTSPVFGLLLAVVFLKERVNARLVLGVGLCLAGVLVVV